ncbi:MAG: hypothetical protein SGJ19_01720 [Planctomycetia bacterium]|mgnify:CR=1 FL=1|nr:hypothetical protein [Planctomycetia bacterium]
MSTPTKDAADKLDCLVRRFQSIAEGDIEVVGAVTLLAEFSDGNQLVTLYEEIQEAAIDADVDDVFDLLITVPGG